MESRRSFLGKTFPRKNTEKIFNFLVNLFLRALFLGTPGQMGAVHPYPSAHRTPTSWQQAVERACARFGARLGSFFSESRARLSRARLCLRTGLRASRETAGFAGTCSAGARW